MVKKTSKDIKIKEFLKELLKPDRKKIILFIIITIAGLSKFRCNNCELGPFTFFIFLPMFILLVSPIITRVAAKTELGIDPGLLTYEQGIYLGYVLLGLWWYLFSCIIIYSIDKFKTKK